MDNSELTKVIEELREINKKQEACAKRGHPGEIVRSIECYRFSSRAYCSFLDCGDMYTRKATPSEIMSINIRVTI